MGKIVFMFPGQGAQYVGMGKDFYDSFACSKEIFDKANEVLDIDVKKLCFEENEDINITEYTQAAMVTASVAILKKIEEMGLKPDLTAGLSLGEYCALVASDVMSFEDAVKVVRQRGILMQDTVPAGEGAMSAVLGMKKEAIEAVLPDVEGIVTIANYNCPGQIVISGESKAVAEAGEALKEAGAKRVLPLKVSGPFHSPMLKPAGEKLLDVLADKLPKGKDENFIFSIDGTKPLGYSAFQRRWDKYKKETGLDITAHQLRHTYATILFEAGIDVKDAQHLLGHSDISVTRNIYTHIRTNHFKETVEKLNTFMN